MQLNEITNDINDLRILKEMKRGNVGITFLFLVVVVIVLLFCGIMLFYVHLQESDKIPEGVFIKEVNVSGLTREEAIQRVSSALEMQMNKTIQLRYKNEVYYVEIEQIEARFDINASVDYALKIGKSGNIFKDFDNYFKVYVNNINIEPIFEYNKVALKDFLQKIEADLPDQLQQPSYYIEDGDLIVTNGVNGVGIEYEQIEKTIASAIQDISYSKKVIDIPTYTTYPDKIDVAAIHGEVYRERENAYFTTDPYAVYPDVVGVDFDQGRLQAEIDEDPLKEEYVIGLDYSRADVTVNDLGKEAFPDLLGSFSTDYVNNPDRTTNLRLAARKINGTVIMPGEEFSYNKVVGKRTISAGYKEAAIYQDGAVVDGVGGGICQVTTTLYNAAIKANMEITQRRNHMFIPSYVGGGKDATVAWGSTDFKFINSRDYPIKIEAAVSDGTCRVKIYGLRKSDDYDNIYLTTKTIKKTSNSIVIDSYRVYERDGEVVFSKKMYRDTYKVH